jgi:hypothetical protein
LQLHATNYNYKLQLEFNVLLFLPYLSQIYMESPKSWTRHQGITISIRPCDDYKVWIVVADIHMVYIGMTNFMTIMIDWSKLIYKLIRTANKPVLGGSGPVHPTYGMVMDRFQFRFIEFWSKNWTGPDF